MNMKHIVIMAALLSSASTVYGLDSPEAPDADSPSMLPRLADEQIGDDEVGSDVHSVPALTFTTEGDQVNLEVEGVRWDHILAIRINSHDITEAVKQAMENGHIRVASTPTGFAMEFDDPTLLGEEDSLFTMILTTGAAVSAPVPGQMLKTLAVTPQVACAWLTFSAPTRTKANDDCFYGSTKCAKPGFYHTAIDYTYSSSSPSAYAAADGKVVKVESKSSGDHGMGNNVIIEHKLSNCNKVYSTYSHLDSIDKAVKEDAKVTRGQKIGVMGGSGYGKSDYWGKHLHFEIKQKPVSGTPQSYNGTCKSGCWGYTPYYPDGYGYNSPKSFY